MNVELEYSSPRGRDVHLTRKLKKPPPMLPNIGDAWLQAGWVCVVEGRMWTEAMDKVTIVLGPANQSLQDLRQIASDLVDAGWTDELHPLAD